MKTVEFGTLFRFIRNGMNVKQDKSGGGLPITRIETISDATVDGTRVGFAGLEEAGCRDWFLETGDILFSHINSVEHVGKCAVYRGKPEKLVHGMNLLCLRSDTDKLLPEFAKYLMRGTEFRTRLSNFINKAVNQASVSIGNLKTIPVTVPPLAKQRRKAEVVDPAEALRAKRRAALAQLDCLTQSLFLDLFGKKLDAPPIDTRADRAHVPRECSWQLLTDVARLATGHTPDRERSDYWNGEIPWISLTDIRSLDGAEATSTLQNVTPLGIENSSSVLLPKGTVCFSRTASVGFVTLMGREMATSQDFMNWVCGPKLDPVYLMWALIMSRQRLLALSSGSTHRTIYMRVVEQFRVLLPPISLQREFARRVAAVEALKTAQRASLAELDALFATLQYRAFRGELFKTAILHQKGEAI